MIDQLMRSLPIDQLAGAVGSDEATTGRAVKAALPALLGGLAANSQSRGGAESLMNALSKHQDGLADNFSLDRVDTTDGEKILGHVFGNNTDGVVNQLGGLGGPQTSAIVRKLLPILAPLVLSWLAKQMGGAGVPKADATGGTAAPAEGGMDMTSILQDVLGQALGGATGARPAQQPGGNILGDVLGGLLGGRR
ncbi:DUF937 domain-containing protein [Ornithinimicrobium panacihumi]|uniref:DUF937 domain-containing protein n=1 Tax=Ornithinimicrobium panacihumi TaxID=2008449 RepID=UPI003F8CEC1F